MYSEGNRFQVRVYLEKRTPVTMGRRGVTTNVIHLCRVRSMSFFSKDFIFSLFLYHKSDPCIVIFCQIDHIDCSVLIRHCEAESYATNST